MYAYSFYINVLLSLNSIIPETSMNIITINVQDFSMFNFPVKAYGMVQFCNFFSFLFPHLYTFTTNHTLTFVPEQISKKRRKDWVEWSWKSTFFPFSHLFFFYQENMENYGITNSFPYNFWNASFTLHIFTLRLCIWEYHRNGVEASFPRTFHKEKNEKGRIERVIGNKIG